MPRTYQCGLDQYGRRRDFLERPELRFGSVDFAVPASYLVRATPQVPVFVFVVDVSFYAVANGSVQVRKHYRAAEITNCDSCLCGKDWRFRKREPDRAISP